MSRDMAARSGRCAGARCGRVVCRPRMRTSTWVLGTGGVASGGVVQSVGRRVAHAAGTEVRTRRPSKDQPLPSAHTATQASDGHEGTTRGARGLLRRQGRDAALRLRGHHAARSPHAAIAASDCEGACWGMQRSARRGTGELRAPARVALSALHKDVPSRSVPPTDIHHAQHPLHLACAGVARAQLCGRSAAERSEPRPSAALLPRLRLLWLAVQPPRDARPSQAKTCLGTCAAQHGRTTC